MWIVNNLRKNDISQGGGSMIEIPEANVIAKQIKEHLIGKKILNVSANQSPHKFAWYYKNPLDYHDRLKGEIIKDSKSFGGFINVKTEQAELLFAEGVNIRYIEKGEKIPKKHQLMIDFDDGSSVVCTIRMYGGIWAFPLGKYDEHENWLKQCIESALKKPSPLTKEFTIDYFIKFLKNVEPKESIKAALATKQRIPGLGNGVLQDILYEAKIHPKRKVESLSNEERNSLYHSIISVMFDMTNKGGRDTETDLFNRIGGYKTKVGRNTVGKPCPICKSPILKNSYLGGSIYYCKLCQPEHDFL